MDKSSTSLGKGHPPTSSMKRRLHAGASSNASSPRQGSTAPPSKIHHTEPSQSSSSTSNRIPQNNRISTHHSSSHASHPSHSSHSHGSFSAAEFSLFVGPIEATTTQREKRRRSFSKPADTKNIYSNYQIHYKIEKHEPNIVKHYHMGEILGQGTYGKVREAYDMQNKRYVAVKILNRKKLLKIRGGVDNIYREIYIMKRLQHRHVVQLYEVFEMETTNKLYLVLELVDGGSLQTRLENSPNRRLDPSEARWWFKQLLEGMEYCHSRGVIHRDIKPSNLMITNDRVLKIADFGVAEVLNRNEMLLDSKSGGEAIDRCQTSWDGSPAFAAPEIASGSDFVSGFKVDVWAIGVTLYLLVTGYVPFQGPTLYKLFENISKGVFPIPQWIDNDLRDLLEHMMDPNEEARYSIAQIKNHRWVLKEDLNFVMGCAGPIDDSPATSRLTRSIVETNSLSDQTQRPDGILTSLSDRCTIM